MQQLTSLQKEFLEILKCFAHNEEYTLPNEFTELEQLYKMAQEHQMIAAVYEKIRKSNVCYLPEYTGTMTAWKRTAIRNVMMQVQREDGFLKIYKKLIEVGVIPLVVKGCICRNLYANPDYRVSSDEDILVKQVDFEKCDQILLQEGFVREELDMDSLPFEIPYRNLQNGVYIELHFSLFSDESNVYGHLNDEFINVFANSVCEEIQGTRVWTLSPTEHLFYLICHSFKHFLHGGFGIRQVCDMVKMSEYYGSRIDWKHIEERLLCLSMKEYWNALVKISQGYLGFSVHKSCYPEAMVNDNIDCIPMLIDLLEGGIYGDSSLERKHSSNITLAAAEKGRISTKGSLQSVLFPSITYMKKKYTWLKNKPFLLPIAWGIRILKYIFKEKNIMDAKQSGLQIGMERVELLKKYGIIE